MNSKFGLILSTVLMLFGISLWSVTVLADDNVADDSEVLADTRSSAESAHREAADDAAARVRASSKLNLDIDMIGRTSIQIAAD